MATWLMLCILQSPERLLRFRREVQGLLLPQYGPNPDELRFDMGKLKTNPYVHGLWNEALRLGSVSSAARVVSRNTELEGYRIQKGSVVLFPVRLMHLNPDNFPEPEEFIPERWITSLPSGASNAEQESIIQKEKKHNANLRTFGGGSGLCSGRFVAEHEILSTVSTMLLLFDMEFEEGQGEISMNPRSLGIMSPAKDPKIRIRRRKYPRNID